ncbi:deaminated glutathione amidase [Georgenia alba]|uniref:Deaminated glutathione amidase n=1 Tax=Georgenia alba TaxID=2233858 RepID=A0ABW2Q9R0_9MICO
MSSLTARAAQFAASTDWSQNAVAVEREIDLAEHDGVDLLVLPEGVLARFTDQKERIREYAQPLDGPFVTRVLQATRGTTVTVVLGVHETSDTDKPYNTLLAVRDGELVARYRKIHLYDAFAARESDNITAADVVPPLVDVAGFRVGLMTCYDVRFPELARLLALAGADVLVLPAAWVRGPLKEHHWSTLVTARALENTTYVVASGECGEANIGRSLVLDPLGVAVAQAGEGPDRITALLSRERLTDARTRLPVLENHRFDVSPTPRPLPVR